MNDADGQRPLQCLRIRAHSRTARQACEVVGTVLDSTAPNHARWTNRLIHKWAPASFSKAPASPLFTRRARPHCGPNAYRTLTAAGLQVYTGAAGTVGQAFEKFKKGEMTRADSADVQGHW